MYSLGITGIEYCNENSTTIWRRGCVSAFGNYIRSHAVSLGAAGVALCIIQVNCNKFFDFKYLEFFSNIVIVVT